MSNVHIKIDLDEVKLLMPSSFDKDYDTPIIHEKIILFKGKAIYSQCCPVRFLHDDFLRPFTLNIVPIGFNQLMKYFSNMKECFQ